jgi:peptide/nickel transport system substrate-binding protein
MAAFDQRSFFNRLVRTSAVLAILPLSALSGAAPSARAADRPIIIGRDMDLNSLDPARAFCDTCQIYLSSVYARLVDLDKDNKTIIPKAPLTDS